MSELIIKRAAATIGTIPIDARTILTKKLMNEDKIVSQFIYDSVIPIELGDYIEFNSKKYYVNQEPNIQKIRNKTFKYTITFESVLYDLYNKLFLSIDGLSDFAYTGDASDMLALVVSNINEITSGWAVGTVDSSETKTVTFTNEKCRTALTKIAQLYNFEFEIIGKTINLKEAIGNSTSYTFEYGRGEGLYSIERRPVQSKAVYTKVFGFGSTRNLSYDYRERQKRLVFEERFLLKNESLYGIREAHYTNEDIFPQRTGTLTAVNNVFNDDGWDANAGYVEDSSIDFDLDEQLLEGIIAKIVFKTGDLAGSQFEIWNYEDSNKRIYFNLYGDTDGYVSPNIDSKPQVGDTYTLVDIKMPQDYIDAAELKLKEETQRYIDENSVPKTLYIVKIDSKYAKENAISIDAGDLVTVVDVHLGIDQQIRISQVSYPLTNPYEISAIIADFVPYTLQEAIASKTILSSKAISYIQNQINQVVNTKNITNNISNKTINISEEYPEKDIVIIKGRPFRFIKGFDNDVNFEILEAGDLITGNYWDRFTYVKLWQYLGGDTWDINNWIQIESDGITSSISARAGTSTISKGKPVYITSFNAGGWYVVEEADSSNAAKMPSIGCALTDLLTSATSRVIISGEIPTIATDSYAQNAALYVASGGGLTDTKPQGTNIVQKVATVTRLDATNGAIRIIGAGRGNDLPNLAEGKIWLGDSNGVPQEADVPTFSRTVDTSGATGYLIVPADKAKIKQFTSSSTITITVNTDSLTNIGDVAEIDHWGTGDLIINAGTATLRVNPLRLLYADGQYSRIAVEKVSATEYRIYGELEIA